MLQPLGQHRKSKFCNVLMITLAWERISFAVVKAVYQKGTKRMVGKLDYVCGSVLADYEATGNDKDMKLLANIYVRENISCASKKKLPYYSVDNYPKICIYCG